MSICTPRCYDAVCRVSNNLAARDKSVRAIQYGSRLILGYYHNVLSQKSCETLQSVYVTASHGRKIFRLLKSVNSLQSLLKILQVDAKNDYEKWTQTLQALEMLFWTIFYFYDNLLLCARLRVLPLDPKLMERRSFACWFIADIFKFSDSLLRWGRCVRDRQRLLEGSHDVNNADNEVVEVKQPTIQEMDAKLRKMTWDIVKAMLDMFVSGSFNAPVTDTVRRVLGKKNSAMIMSDGHVGLAAVISSLMNLYEMYEASK